MKFISESPEQTQKIADDFVSGLLPNDRAATVIGLYGNLGAGKTTLTQCIARNLGVEETVTSPTFVIEKIYELTGKNFTHLIHIDAYRIEKSEELLHLGWRDIISDSHNLILVEWPEKVLDIMPVHIRFNLGHISENSREIEIIK
jgi:tRNA threonylcarbamoyladenosine biosynthesis protein TsaE